MRKRSKKSWEGYRRKRVGDLKHMLACCESGRLPEQHCAYLRTVLRDPLNLPKPKEIAEAVQLTASQQETNKLYTIPPIDLTPAQLKERRKARERQRKMLARRRARTVSRAAYLAAVASAKPWVKAGVSRRTWFRYRAQERKMAPGASGPLDDEMAPGSSGPLKGVALGSSARITLLARTDPVPPAPTAPSTDQVFDTFGCAPGPPQRGPGGARH
jgi:hypothetical protein